MKKKVLALILTAAMVVGLAACGGSTSNDAASTTDGTTTEASDNQTGDETTDTTEAAASTGEKILSVQVGPDPETIDPALNSAVDGGNMLLHSFECLLEVDENGQLVPGQAESWETSEDGLTWTFHLREGVKFHDGDVMDSGDVVASINLASNPDSPSAYSSYTSSFESVEAPDANTVVIKTERPNPLMLFDVAQLYVLKQEIAEVGTEEQVADNVIGTGRYKFVEQVKEDHIDLAANEDYWGEVPAIKNVRFRPITNEATRTATMLTGDVDFTIDVSARDIDRLDATEGISVIKQKGLREIYLNLDSREDSPLFPGQKNPMSDVKVRQAMYLAIDEGTIIKNIMNGCAYEMNSVVPEDYVGYTEVTREAYDPEKAKELLAEAGYPDGFEVTFDAPNDRYMNDEQIAQAVAGYLEKVGIKVNLNLMPKANFFSYIKPLENKSMFLMTGWSDASGDGLSLMHDMLYTYDREAGNGGVNRGHYSNAQVDALIDQAFTEMDDTKRGELVAEADKIAREDYAYIPLHFEQDTYAIKDTLNYTPRMNKYVYAWEFSYK